MPTIAPVIPTTMPAAIPTAIPTAMPAPATPTAVPDAAAQQRGAGDVDVDGARHGGTLNVASMRGIGHQDVHYDVSAALAAWGPGLAYSRLMRFKGGPDVELPSLAVECDVCAGWTMVDGETFEFRLRDGVVWQDLAPVNGRALTAGDIAFSYGRQREDGAPNAPLLRLIDAVEAPSDDLLRIRIRAADADFLRALADGHSKIVAREAVALSGHLRGGPTVGSGAWVFMGDGGGSEHVFERNASYYEAGLPYLDRLRVHVIPDAATAYAAFRVQRLDAHRLRAGEWAALLEQTPDAGERALDYMETGAGMEVAFKATAPPFDDAGARRAAMYAMRPWRAIDDIWGGKAHVAQGMPLAAADWALSDDELRGYFGDPERGRELLAGVGRALPIAVTISAGDFGPEHPEYLAHAERIAEEMRAVGFAPEVELLNRRRFGEDVWFGGDYQMYAGPAAPVSHPNGYLLAMLSGGGAWNTTGHMDAGLDAAIAAQAQEYGAAARAALAREAQRLALDGGYRFMPAAAVSTWAWRRGVRGFHPNFAGSEYGHWGRVWLDGG